MRGTPADGVYYTLARHGTAHQRPAVMIEIRNDLIAGLEGVARWVSVLTGALTGGEA